MNMPWAFLISNRLLYKKELEQEIESEIQDRAGLSIGAFAYMDDSSPIHVILPIENLSLCWGLYWSSF